MEHPRESLRRLAQVTGLRVFEDTPLSGYTRFAIGGPADVLVDTEDADAFVRAWDIAQESDVPVVVIGAGSNLIVSDEGFRGIVLRFAGRRITAEGAQVTVEAGALLQDLIDFAIAQGLAGLETMAGIPGWVGAAIYGNAGAYGHSISESVREVVYFDGERLRTLDNAGCRFRYRESIFKQHKEWIIFSGRLELTPADSAALRRIADEIVDIRNRKFPPTMKCAGSIFKNFLLADLPAPVAGRVPETVIREGKVPAAYFLEQVGAKGMRLGGIQIADYHANLIYNAGEGTARDLCALIAKLKQRVRAEFGLDLEEEVQYVGFPDGVRTFSGAASPAGRV